ncbi:uncharacterized protein LOC132611630 [Lycium barbarum]|uniref:uncharacterized protein LOC132611630 n=1 Tax=Lycium barbarum TaxID=112863 RepID=UPI00293F2118|nr:uncharacterized protein LOC132611630 [Lycium barbarum]
MPSSLKFQLPILVSLFFLSSFSFYATANFFNVDIIDELIDPLSASCVINGDITQPRVDLRQSGVHRYPVEVAVHHLNPTLLCNMTSGPRFGTFLLFDFNRDIPRCDIQHKRCTWNIRPEGLFLYFNFEQNLVFNWSMSSSSNL